MKLSSIIGARPQFVKVAAICRALVRDEFRSAIRHSIIHTGQHYDREMSDVFFSELNIPQPDFNLGVGSGTHAEQTAEMMTRLEKVLLSDPPDWVLLYGDTNSTVAGALVCAKLGIPLAHIEAGLRSFNRQMPEEINRVVADHLSNLLFCPTEAAMRNAESEGLRERSILSGDIMYDAFNTFQRLAETRTPELLEGLSRGAFALATLHRAENVDSPERLRAIVSALETIAATVCPVVLPLHPRTHKNLDASGIALRRVRVLPPVSYLEMVALESNARFIVTDSGGVQKEAYFAHKPCITTRDETEWVETLERRCNVLVGAGTDAIVQAAANVNNAGPWLQVYGDGHSSELIVDAILQNRPSRQTPLPEGPQQALISPSG